VDHLLPELVHNDAVMLSEAKHPGCLAVRNRWANDHRLFASFRMTFADGRDRT
jgi:hypothetical protein